MSGDAARPVDPEFPNLPPEVVEGYRNAPETMIAEVIDGELSLMRAAATSSPARRGRAARTLRPRA